MSRRFFFLLLLFYFCVCNALQTKSVKENHRVDVVISEKELSRIFIEGDRIQSTQGLNGAYELMKDEKMGAIFIKPTPFFQKKSFNLFLTTEQGRIYNLFLTPKDIPAEIIQLKPVSPALKVADHWEQNSPYIDKIISLNYAMNNDIVPDGYAVQDVAGIYPKRVVKGVSAQLVILYQGNRLNGEIWLLKNENKKSVAINHKMFMQRNVRSIALEDDVLFANEESYLYRITSHD